MVETTTVEAVAEKLKRKWGVEMDFWEIAANAKDVLREVGLIPMQKRVLIGRVANFQLPLGGSVYKVFSVIHLEQPYITGSGTIEFRDIIHPPQIVWTTDEVDDPNETLTAEELVELNYITQIKGPYIDFTFERPNIKFNVDDFEAAVFYSCIATDSEDMILIPVDAVDALANYCAEIYMKPLMLLGKVQMGIYDRLMAETERSFGAARIKMHMNALSQNHIDKLLNIMTSMDRKHTNKPA